MERRHELGGGIEGNFPKARTTSALGSRIESGFCGEHDEGGFGGIANNAGAISGIGHQHRVGTQQRWQQCCRHFLGGVMAARRRNRTRG